MELGEGGHARDQTTSFGERLRRLRSAAGLSQEALADRSGVSRNGIGDLERGRYPTPRFETVRLLADGLGLGEEEQGGCCWPWRDPDALSISIAAGRG